MLKALQLRIYNLIVRCLKNKTSCLFNFRILCKLKLIIKDGDLEE